MILDEEEADIHKYFNDDEFRKREKSRLFAGSDYFVQLKDDTMYEMNDKREQKKDALLAKDCAYIAVFVAFVIAAQVCLAVFPGVELVTVLFVTFSFAFGVKKGMIAATTFSLLRQLVFGFYPTVLILYLVYFNALAWLFGVLGKRVKACPKNLVWLTAIACVCTLLFGLFDGVLTPLWYGYTARAAKIYFYASFTVTLPQIVCTAVTVGGLFLPLVRILLWLGKNHKK